MPDGLKLVDMHTHLFPSSEADLRGLAPERAGPRTIPDFREFAAKNGIVGGACMLFIPSGQVYRDALAEFGGETRAANRERAREISLDKTREFNEWGIAAGKENPDIDFFVWIDVIRMSEQDAVAELDRLVQAGAKGYKIVPRDLPIMLDDRRMWPIYEYCQDHDLPVLTAAGAYTVEIDGRTEAWMHPRYVEPALAAFPELRMCIAHMAIGADDGMVELRQYENCFGDLSERLDKVPNEPEALDQLTDFVRNFDAERVMFGSNFGSSPLRIHQEAVDKFMAMPLTDAERENIASNTWNRYRAK